MFPPEYERLPKNVHFKYNGEKMQLSEASEEAMGFYAAMLRTDYVTDEKKSELFSKNFFADWRGEMTDAERAKIKGTSLKLFVFFLYLFLSKFELFVKFQNVQQTCQILTFWSEFEFWSTSKF